MQAALASVSPLDLVEALPTESVYYIFQADNDESVSKTMHSDRFVAKMKETHRIMYYVVPNSGHCDLTEEMQQRYDEHVLRAALGE